MRATTETILTNARIVCPDREVNGTVVVEDGRITDILPRNVPGGTDLRGAFLVPGVIDIHSDYLERELSPRPTAKIPLELALHVMDQRALSSGLTTVATAARIAHEREGRPEREPGRGGARSDGLKLAKRFEELATEMRVHHVIHLRWNTNFEPDDNLFEEMLALKTIGNLVFNDDAPGQRQFRDIEALIQQQATRRNIPIEEARKAMEERLAQAQSADRLNNRMLVKERLAGHVPIGSHDDTTVEHVIEAFESGATLSEMPCTIEAARKAKELGMMVCMGAPNYYRGGSHCGNLGCHDAMAEDLVDIICSDYHFPSMLASLTRMVEEGMTLSAATNLFTLNPAKHLRIDAKTGSIELGKQADLVAFHHHNGFGDVERVWVDGVVRFSSSMERHRRPNHEPVAESLQVEEAAVLVNR
jgi:alpha-D-ribose 1-methylphosphonate 5-triphosphate diphosphatase